MRMKKLFVGILCLIFLGNTSFAMSLPNRVGNYFIGYQSGLQNYMKKFDMVITDTRNYTKDEIMQVKANGTVVIGYVSIGEEVGLQKGDGLGPGGYASWYFDGNNDGKPDQNGEFGSYYTNAANSLWVQRVLNIYARDVVDKGADGFFLDTVSTCDLYPESKDGVINLIKKLREKYPDKVIIQNWGFSIVDSTAPYVNAVMWESWYPDSTNPWVVNWQNKFKQLKTRYGIDVITLGYYEKYNNLERYFEASKELGFIPYVSSSDHMEIVVNFFSSKRVIVPEITQVERAISQPSIYRTAFMEPYKPVGQAMLIGPISERSGWSVVKSHYGLLHREARGWDAGVEFTISDNNKDAEIGVYYLDDKPGALLGLSYYKWDNINKRPVWSTVAVKKWGSGYVRGYKFIIPKEAFVDNNPTKPGIQVVVGIGGLSPVDKIKSVTFRQL